MDMDVAEDVEYDAKDVAKDDPVVDIAFRGTKITGRSTPVISGPVRPKLSTLLWGSVLQKLGLNHWRCHLC